MQVLSGKIETVEKGGFSTNFDLTNKPVSEVYMAKASLPNSSSVKKPRAYRSPFHLMPDSISLNGEEWRVDETGIYSVSNCGRVFSHRRGHLIGAFNAVGYCVMPRVSRPGNNRFVHRVVYELFAGPIPEGYEINHKDGNKANNRIENLEAVTRSENIRHSYRELKRKHPKAKLTEDQVNEIRRRYADGEILRALAEEFGIGKGAASRLVRGVTWKGVSKALTGRLNSNVLKQAFDAS